VTNIIHYKFFFITGVSGEKVEVDPVGSKGAKFFKQRAMTYDADSIASCEILEEKSIGNKTYCNMK